MSLVSYDLDAQQDPHYTQYMYNMNVVNPAYAGSRGTLSIGILGRTQWVGIRWCTKDIDGFDSCTCRQEFGCRIFGDS